MMDFTALATHDLHYHFDGSVSPEVIRVAFAGAPELVARKLPRIEGARLSKPVVAPEDFFGLFKAVHDVFNDPSDTLAILKAQLGIARREGIQHIDYRFGCGALSRRLGRSEDEILAIFEEAIAYGGSLGLAICPTLCFSRHESLDRARYLKDFVSDQVDLIRAVDLEGPESPNNTLAFGSLFKELKHQGLHVTVHAGEFSSAESIWQAIDECGAERIGHGFTACDDKELIRRLAKDQIPVEVCLTSNYITGLCADLGEHPFVDLMNAGVPVVLCTDDQAIFQTSLALEYEKAAGVLQRRGYQPHAILAQVAKNAVRYAFGEAQ